MPILVPQPFFPNGFRRALRVFHETAETVPAYGKFLASCGVAPGDVQTVEDFAGLPVMTKDNYLKAFGLDELLPNGDIAAAGTWSCSSGSSGRPTYWGRGGLSFQQSVTLYGRILRQFGADRRSTLVVNCFAAGNWIAGTYTFRAIAELAEGALPRVSVISPGIDADEVRRNIATLGRFYDQVVIAGYPPFVRDILDGAGTDVLNQHLLLLLAGESITENWRDGVLRMMRQPGRVGDVCLIYGTADAGIMGYETPETIALRRRALEDAALNDALFGGRAESSTFVEFDSAMRYTETDSDGRLLFTVGNALPLVRYRINDEGRVFTPAQAGKIARKAQTCADLRTAGPDAGFIVLHGRRDVAVTFYAVNIFPEPIKTALSDRELTEFLTGLFQLVRTHDERLRDRLELRVQLRDGVRVPEGLDGAVRNRVVSAMAASSSEYRELRRQKGESAEPAVTFHEHGSEYFRYAIKQIWKG